ncbi:MAG TPA: ABC transporter substrate-binding protein [Blastococcus sp.]|nr:ABC transporter substrate-binding protein [Blastococcus sp.]
MGPKLELELMLATDWEFSEDGRSVTFTLRDDVTFSDGAVLDAAAVKASLDRALTLPESTVRAFLTMIESVEVVDAQHVRVNSNRPAMDLPYVLASTEGSIISPNALGNPDRDVAPVGSGPYLAEDVRLGSSITFVRRDGYWDPEAAPSARIEMVSVPDDNTRTSALRAGEYDLSVGKLGQLDQLQQLSDYTTTLHPAAPIYTIGLNTARPNIDNVLVRQALNYAIDRDAINSALTADSCDPIGQPLTESYDGHLTDPPVEYDYDVEKAKELLAEAGVPDGFAMTIVHGQGIDPEGQIAEAVQGMLAKVGIDVTVLPVDGTQLYANWAAGQYDGFITPKPTKPTGAMTLSQYYLSKARYPGPPPEGFAEALQPAYDPALTEEERVQAVEDASSIAVEQAMDVYICAVPTIITYADDVVGAESMGASFFQGIADLRNVGIAKG